MPSSASPVPPPATWDTPESAPGPVPPPAFDDALVEASNDEASNGPAGQACDGSTVGDWAVVQLTDATFRDGVAELRWRLREQILAGVRVLVVDVSAVRQLSSTAVAALLGAHRSCRARGGRVIIRDPNRRTLDLLRRTGLWRVLRPEFTDPGRARHSGQRAEGR